jgi:GAF domain-containing protein
MDGRLTVLPQERLVAVRHLIEAQLREAATLATGEKFAELFDGSMRALLTDGFRRAGAEEGTLWLLDEAREALVPRFNSGPNAEGFVDIFRQSLRSGMISMVVAMEQPICENDVQQNRQQDKTLDAKLQLQTCAMLAVPFYFVGELRGVLSCVQLAPAGADCLAPRSFSPEDLQTLQLTGGVLSRLIEHRLLGLCLGVEGLG